VRYFSTAAAGLPPPVPAVFEHHIASAGRFFQKIFEKLPEGCPGVEADSACSASGTAGRPTESVKGIGLKNLFDRNLFDFAGP
jgi:hypothetical protein